jgi:hypothetical protein
MAIVGELGTPLLTRIRKDVESQLPGDQKCPRTCYRSEALVVKWLFPHLHLVVRPDDASLRPPPQAIPVAAPVTAGPPVEAEMPFAGDSGMFGNEDFFSFDPYCWGH